MFDWNDDELTNIIWDEAGESDGHFVSYRDQVEDKKETSQDTANVSPVEPKKPSIKSEHGVELDSSSKGDCEHATGFGLHSWHDELDASLSDAANADPNSPGTAALKHLTKSSENGSLRSANKAIQLEKDSEIFQNPPEDTEHGDFVDYGWANIESFDDLDRIFSNDDPIFGDMNVGDADELWSSSKDVTSSPLSPAPLPGDSSNLATGPLRTSSDRSEIKAQYMLDPGQSFISRYEKLNEITSEDVQASIDTNENYGGKSKLFVKEKTSEMGRKIKARHEQLDEGTAVTVNEYPDEGNKDEILLKGQKSDKNSGLRQLHDLCGTWSSSGSPFQQANSQYAPPLVNQFPSLASSQENHFSGPILTSPMYGNPELVSSGYEVPRSKVNRLKMTPKEKIEKLRRRQQLRAILAIQKQQQQFGNQVAVAEHSTMEGGTTDVDKNINSFPPMDPNSPIDHDDSNSMVFDNCSVEESVLYHLRDAIAKLELKIRFCIRDSLFRLAQSAKQRKYGSDTSSGNTSSRDEVLWDEGVYNHERFTRKPDVETDTNPIDRTVAHLLFYCPLEFSGKPAEMPELPVSAYVPYERETDSLKSLAQDYFPDCFENTQMASPQGSKTIRLCSEGDQLKKSPRLDSSENASNNDAADEGMTRTDASK